MRAIAAAAAAAAAAARVYSGMMGVSVVSRVYLQQDISAAAVLLPLLQQAV